MKLLQNMPMRSRLMLGASVVGVLIVAFFLFSLASKPSFSMVATGLDPAKTGKMTAALDASGVAYELRNNGTALAVEKSQTAQAQIALADAGLSTSGTGGGEAWEQFDNAKLGASNFQQQVAYQRALEAQIAATIGQVEGVSGAQVQLTLPDDQLFADEAQPATAAVLLSGDSTSMESGAVQGIANLVASSVEGLKTDNVTITDGAGQMLWPTGDGVGSGGAMSKTAAEARYAAQLESKINGMLMRTLGPDKAQVQVNPTLNVDKTSIEELEYAKRGTPTEITEEAETLEGQGGGGGGAAGMATNVPGYAGAGGGAGGESNYDNEASSQKLLVGKTVTRREVAPGTVESLDVALVVDKSVPRADLAGIRDTVASAAGIDDARGDTLSLTQLAFAEVPEAAKPLMPADGILGYAKYALLGLASLLFLFFITRHLRRRENEELVSPTWLRQLDAPTPIAQLAAADAPTLVAAGNPSRKQVDDVVKKEPERVATALRTWMNEDK